MHICTIVARNYLAAARVLARSFSAHNSGTCWTLVIDDVDGEVRSEDEPFEVLTPTGLEIDRLHQMLAGYSVLELSTAVKPWLLRHLLHRRGVERVTYLDPDIQVFDSLGEVEALLRGHPLVVTPHLTAPMPRDGHRPSETDILISGAFNLGFAGFARGEEVDRLLDWWSERLATDCLVAPERGYFVDQRWMDLAPGLIPGLAVLRDPGYNVAYWNLSSREVSRDDGRYAVNDRPLRFFHFSGYDPQEPDRLSKHQNRVSLADRPVIRELCDGYGRALAAEGHDRWRARPYAWGSLPDGTPLDAAARAVFRDAVHAGALGGESVFTDAGAQTLLDYLRGPATHGGDQGVTRYMEALWAARSDLRETFPDLDGPDGGRMVAWAEFWPDLIPSSLRADGAQARPRRPGVHVAGYFLGVMGTGEHGRQLVAALRSQEIPVTLTTLHPDASPEDDALQATDASGPASPAYFNLVCANADLVPDVSRQLGDEFFANRYSIGFWAWEVSAFPDRYLAALAHLDEVWVGSRHVRDAIAELATIPVLVIPQPVSLEEGFADAPAPADLPDGFRFLFAFDYLSVFERKNPLATLAAFTRAFAPGSGAVLVIKTLNPEHDPVAHARLTEAAALHPDVHLLERRLSTQERDGLMNAADCYVSLHRAEGFGYTMAESMWAGKPVIATGYSGNLDYMTADNSYLVDNRLVPIGEGHEPYPAHGVWAEPDVDHAAHLMREVFENREEAARRGARAAADIRTSHSPEACGGVIADRLRRILASPSWRWAARGAARPGVLYTDGVGKLIESGPVVPKVAPRFGAGQRLARKGLLRVLKPVTVHERLVDDELLAAIRKLDANLRELSTAHTGALRQIDDLRREISELRSEDAAGRDPLG